MSELQALRMSRDQEVSAAKAYLYKVLPQYALDFIRDHRGISMGAGMAWLLANTDLDAAWVAAHDPAAYYATCEMHLELTERAGDA